MIEVLTRTSMLVSMRHRIGELSCHLDFFVRSLIARVVVSRQLVWSLRLTLSLLLWPDLVLGIDVLSELRLILFEKRKKDFSSSNCPDQAGVS